MARILHIKICQGHDLKKMDTIGRSDPYVTLRLKSQDKKQALTTLVLSNTLDPIWNQEFDITAIDPNDTLYIDMCDEGIKNDDKMMGRLEYPVSTWQIGAPVDHKEVELTLETKKAGRLIFEVSAFPAEGVQNTNERSTEISPVAPKLAPKPRVDVKIKRGYPLSRHQKQFSDTINHSKIQWYYNWSPYPTDTISSEIEFVPMIFGMKNCEQKVFDHINDLYNQNKIKYCLILNEPDLPSQANMTFDQVIQSWYSIRTNLNKNIKISSPVYASLTKGRQELKTFFDALTSRKIQKPDFISLHLSRSLDDYSQISICGAICP